MILQETYFRWKLQICNWLLSLFHRLYHKSFQDRPKNRTGSVSNVHDQLATLQLNHRKIHAKTCDQVGSLQRRNISPVLAVIVLNHASHNTFDIKWGSLVDSVAILLGPSDIRMAKPNMSTREQIYNTNQFNIATGDTNFFAITLCWTSLPFWDILYISCREPKAVPMSGWFYPSPINLGRLAVSDKRNNRVKATSANNFQNADIIDLEMNSRRQRDNYTTDIPSRQESRQETPTASWQAAARMKRTGSTTYCEMAMCNIASALPSTASATSE